MQYQGLVFSLDAFPGEVIVRQCSFENNLFRYDSCLNVDVRAAGGSRLLAQPYFQNNFKLVHRSRGTVHNKVQLKALMNFVNHANKLGLFDNTFVNHTGLKGIINIDRDPRSQYASAAAFALANNRFVNSSGLIDSNVLNVRTKVGSLSGHDPSCGGITLSGNRFERSVGCQYTHGAVHLYCYDAGRRSRFDLVKYVPEIDAQYFIGNHFKGSIGDPQAYEEDGGGTVYRHDGKGRSSDQRTKAIRQAINLTKNEYIENVAGAKRSVVQVEGFPTVWSKEERYERNENWFQLLVDQWSVFTGLKPEDSPEARAEALSKTVLRIDKAFLINYPSKSESILTIWRPARLVFDGSVFSGNVIVDDVDPTSRDVNTLTLRNQSHGLLVKDFAGEVTFAGGTSFDRHIGIDGSRLLSRFVVGADEYKERGIKARTLTF